MILTSQLLVDDSVASMKNEAEQLQSESSDELWFSVNFGSLSQSIHRFCLLLSYQNESGNHTFVEEFSFDFTAMPFFHSHHTNHLLRMKWIQPGMSAFLLVLFLGILLFCFPSSSYELLSWIPSSPRSLSLSLSLFYYLRTIQYRLQRVLAFSILRYLFISFALSLCFGVYFVGRMDGVWFVAFAWGVFSFDSTDGFEYAFWTELLIWGAVECLGIAIPMLLFCMQSVYRTRYDMDKRRSRGTDCWSRWILCGIACTTFFIQLLLLQFNFPLHVCFLSANLVLFPLASIFIPLVFFKK